MSARLIDHGRFLRLSRSRDFLAAHACQPIRIQQAASEAGIALHHYIRLYSQAFGETPGEFLQRHRIEHAQQLLRGGSASVTDACFASGYQSLGTFSSLFHRFTGVAPSNYRRLWNLPNAPLLFSVPACFAAFWT